MCGGACVDNSIRKDGFMGNINEIFKEWESKSIEDLLSDAETGAKIELARRTQSEEDYCNALRCAYVNTKEAVFALALARNDEMLKVLLQHFDSMIIPLLTRWRNLEVEGNEDWYAWLLQKLKGKATSLLGSIVADLGKLQVAPIKETSSAYKRLLEYGYAAADIAYLNYKFLESSCSNRARGTLIAKLLREYFSQKLPFRESQKRVIESVISFKFDYSVNGCSGVADLVEDYDEITEKSNWAWIRALATTGVLKLGCGPLRTRPLEEPERFAGLGFEEKLASVDYLIPQLESKEDIMGALVKLDMREYLINASRKLPSETFSKLVQCGLLDLKQTNEENRIDWIKGLKSRESYNWVMANLESVPDFLECLGYSSNYYYGSVLDFKREFLTEDEARHFISVAIEAAYKDLGERFVSFAISLLKDKYVSTLYSKETMLGILDTLKECYPKKLSTWDRDKIEELYLSPTELEELRESREIIAKAERAERTRLESIAIDEELSTLFSDVSDIDELYSKYKGHHKYRTGEQEELCKRAVSTADDLLKVATCFDERYFKIYLEAYNKECLDFLQLASKIGKLSELEGSVTV